MRRQARQMGPGRTIHRLADATMLARAELYQRGGKSTSKGRLHIRVIYCFKVGKLLIHRSRTYGVCLTQFETLNQPWIVIGISF
jgi:hypothetical protein